MAAILEPDVMVTSYDVISLCCGPQRKHPWMYYLPSKFRCHSFSPLVRAGKRLAFQKEQLTDTVVGFSTPTSTRLANKLKISPVWIIFQKVPMRTRKTALSVDW